MSAFVSRHSATAEVYGVSLQPDRLHLPDGSHAAAGITLANRLDRMIRQAPDNAGRPGLLCNGCTMLTLYNASVALAMSNGQDPRELAHTMAAVYSELGRFLDANPGADAADLFLKHLRIER